MTDVPKQPISIPEVPEREDKTRDVAIRTANYLIDNGYVKNISLSDLIAQLLLPVEQRNAKNVFTTFNDLNDPE